MKSRYLLAILALGAVAVPDRADPHGFAGDHLFISTLLIDDPNVADEMSIPTFSYLPQPTSGGPASDQYGLGFEYDKRIEVVGPNAQRVDNTSPHLVAGDATLLSVGVRSLTPGTYTVACHVASVDTHRMDGTYHFTVAATDTSDIRLDHVWARATAGVATTGAAYFTVTNKGQPDRLVGITTPVATMADLHETTNDNGVMKMRPVRSISLVPGKPVTFRPGGYHVMLTGLKSPLKAGESFPLTLTFEHARPITVTAKVEAGGVGMDHGGMERMPGMQGH